MKLTTLILILAVACATQAEPLVSDSLTSSPPMKNEILAYGLAMAGTILPILVGANIPKEEGPPDYKLNYKGEVIIVSGILIGPSLGQFYAGFYSQGIIALLVRGLGGEFMFAGYGTGPGFGPSPITVIGPGIVIGGTVYSLIDTYFAVKRANEKIKPQHFGFAPELFPSSNGGLKPGMMAWARF